MSDEPTSTPASGEQKPSEVVHHGEALVAALLNTQKIVQNREVAPTGETVSEPVASKPPLTASSVISHTDPAAFQPASAADVVGGSLADADGSDSVGMNDDASAAETPGDEPDRAGIDDGSGSGGDDGSGDGVEEDPGFVRNVLEWIVVLGAAVAVAIILRTFVFQAFYIPSESMETTLFERDRILVNKVSYRLHDVNRGDVVVFRRPEDQPAEIRDLIKRVIGLPGETVEGRNSSIYINGQLLVEPYLDGNSFGDFGPVEVPAGELFMMGDNRDQSLDSRRFGTIAEDRVVGRAFFLFFPFDRIGSL